MHPVNLTVKRPDFRPIEEVDVGDAVVLTDVRWHGIAGQVTRVLTTADEGERLYVVSPEDRSTTYIGTKAKMAYPEDFLLSYLLELVREVAGDVHRTTTLLHHLITVAQGNTRVVRTLAVTLLSGDGFTEDFGLEPDDLDHVEAKLDRSTIIETIQALARVYDRQPPTGPDARALVAINRKV